MVLPNNLTGIRKQIGNLAGNIAGAKAIGGKEQQSLFSVSYADNGKVSYVSEQTRLDILSRGPLVATGNNGDIALSKGNGMFVFKQNVTDTSDQEFRFRGTGSLRIDKNGYLSTSADGTGYKLMGYKIDENGNLPTVTSLLSSLTPVSIRDAILKPEATTSVAVNRLRLDSDKTVLHGPGDIIKINKSNLNSSLQASDIIIPEENNFSSLKQGDRLSLTSTPPGGQPKTFEYGGIAISKKINGGTGGFYKAVAPGTQFDFAGPGVAHDGTGRDLVRGDAITIRFNGIDTVLTAELNGADQTFNSLTGLKNAINKFIPGLTATISDGRILIAADDTAEPVAANGAITFADANGGNLVRTLGLVDVTATTADYRFATLKTLQKRVNLNNENTGLKADLVGTNLDLHSLIASSSLALDGSSSGITNFSRATIGAAFAVADGGNDRGRATVTIESPKHGLKAGDKLWITNIAQPGFYMVTFVPNSDNFTISLVNNNPTAFPAAPAAPAPYAVPAGATWQKIASEKFETDNTSDIGVTNAGNVIIRLPNPATTTYANNDVVYISGFGARAVGGQNPVVPDGYYVVRNYAGGPPQTIQIIASAGAAGNVAVAAQGFSVGVTKVGVSGNGANFGPNNFNSVAMTTNTGQAAGGNTVRIFLPNTNYNIGDTLRLDGLPAPVVIDGITLNAATAYTVTAKDPNGNWIDFIGGAGGAVGANVDAVYGANAGDVPITLRTNDYALTSKYLGLQNQKPNVFAATYSEVDHNLSISNIDPQTSKHAGKVFNTAIKVVDSLGAEHELIMNFARLQDNEWIVEVAGVKNADGSYDFDNDRPDGVLAVGRISFDENGKFAGSTIPPLSVNWTTNGSLPSDIIIDWNDALSGKGITQFRGASLAEEIIPNGHTVGTVDNFDIDENGKVYAIFDNGQRIAIYQVPVAMAANMNGLEGTADGMFIPGPLSGPMLLRIAGENGAPTVISKAYESSNIDSLKSILELNETANHMRSGFAVLKLKDILDEEAIKKIG
jgi:flagellar hook-basal body protein